MTSGGSMAAAPRPRKCTAVLPSGERCCELGDFTLYMVLEEIYNKRIRDAEKHKEPKEIIVVLKDYTFELRNINKILIKTVQELECEARNKVVHNHSLNTKIECLTKKVQKLSDEIGRKDNKVKCFEENVDKLSEQLQERQCQINQLMEDLAKCKSSVNDCQECEVKLSNLEYCAEKLKAENEAIKKASCKKDKLNEELQKEICELKEIQRNCKCDKGDSRRKCLKFTEILESSNSKSSEEEKMSFENKCSSTPLPCKQPGLGIPHYQSGRGIESNNAEVARLKCRIAELEAALSEARGQICNLNRTIQDMAKEAANSRDSSSCKWYTFPDASISTKFEDYQNSIDDSSRKMELMVKSIKDNDLGDIVLSDIDEYQQFLGNEKDKLDSINSNLCNLLTILKSNKGEGSDRKEYKIECLEKKLCSVMKKIRRMSCESSFCSQNHDDSEKEQIFEDLISKLDEVMMGMQELKSDSMMGDESGEMNSLDGSIVIREIMCDVKSSLSDLKRQETKLSALSDMLRCESQVFKSNMKELSQLLASNGEDLNQMKQELKLAICETSNAAEEVKKRTEKLKCLEETINTIQQVICNYEHPMGEENKFREILDRLVYAFKEVLSTNKPSNDKCKKGCNTDARLSRSTPHLGCESGSLFNSDSFENRCYAAQALCNELKKEFDSVDCKLNQKQMKMSEMGKRVENLEKQIQCAIDKIDKCCDDIQDNSGSGYCRAIKLLEGVNRSLVQVLQRLSIQLRKDQCELKHHENSLAVSRKLVDAKMDELECTLNELTQIKCQQNEGGYEKSTNKCAHSDKLCQGAEPMDWSMESINDQNQKLVEEIGQLKRTIKCHEQTIKEYKQQIGCMNCEMTKRDLEVCQQIKLLVAEKEATETENEQVKQELQAKNSKKDARCQIDKLNERLCEKEKKINCLMEKLNNLRQELDEKENRILGQENEICRLEQELCDLKQALKELEKETKVASTMNQECIEKEQLIQQKDCNIAELEQHVCKQQENIEQLLAGINEGREEFVCILNEKEQIIEDLQHDLHCLKHDKEELENDIRDFVKQIQSSEDNLHQINEQGNQNDQVKNLKMNLCFFMEEHNKDLKEIEALRMELKKKNDLVNCLKKDLDRAECKLRQLNGNNKQGIQEDFIALQQQKECLEERIIQLTEELRKCKGDINCAVEKISSLSKENCMLKEKLRCNKNMCDKSKNADIEEVENELVDKIKEIEDLKCQMKQMESENANLYQRLVSTERKLQLACEEDQEKVDREEVERDGELRKAVRQAIVDKENALVDLSCTERKLANLSTCYQELKDKFMTVRQEYEQESFDLMNENHCLDQQLQIYKDEIRKLECEIKKYEKISIQSTMSEAELQKLLTEKDEEWACRYKSLCKEKLDLLEEINNLKTELRITDLKMSHREESCNHTKDKIWCIQQRLEQKEFLLKRLQCELAETELENKELKTTLTDTYKKVEDLNKYLCQLRMEKKELLKKVTQFERVAGEGGGKCQEHMQNSSPRKDKFETPSGFQNSPSKCPQTFSVKPQDRSRNENQCSHKQDSPGKRGKSPCSQSSRMPTNSPRCCQNPETPRSCRPNCSNQNSPRGLNNQDAPMCPQSPRKKENVDKPRPCPESPNKSASKSPRYYENENSPRSCSPTTSNKPQHSPRCCPIQEIPVYPQASRKTENTPRYYDNQDAPCPQSPRKSKNSPRCCEDQDVRHSCRPTFQNTPLSSPRTCEDQVSPCPWPQQTPRYENQRSPCPQTSQRRYSPNQCEHQGTRNSSHPASPRRGN